MRAGAVSVLACVYVSVCACVRACVCVGGGVAEGGAGDCLRVREWVDWTYSPRL